MATQHQLTSNDVIVYHSGMPNELISLRLPEDMLEQLDEYAAALSQYVGVPVTRNEVIRKFITEGLDKAPVTKRPRKK